MSKYGLQLRGPSSAKPSARAAVPSLFSNDDDDESGERELAREAVKQRSIRQAEEQQKKALEQDPNVFDYDSFYDESKQNRGRFGQRQREEKRVPKYIPALLKSQKKRDLEHDNVYEKNLAKERAKEDHLYADKDKFVTRGYKEKLAEREKWEAEERMREAKEREEDVTKRSDLGDFYRNFLNANAVPHEERGRGEHASPRAPLKSDGAEKKAPAPPQDNSNIPAARAPRQETAEQLPNATKSRQVAEEQEQQQGTIKAEDAVRMEVCRKEREESARERYLARKKLKQG